MRASRRVGHAGRLLAAACLPGALLALAACASGGATTAYTGPDVLVGATPAARLALQARDIAFDPRELAARAGQVIAIDLDNRGTLRHDFTIQQLPGDVSNVGRSAPDDYAVHVALPGREQRTLLLRVSAPGSYAFFCAVPGHRAAGMHGTLVVQ